MPTPEELERFSLVLASQPKSPEDIETEERLKAEIASLATLIDDEYNHPSNHAEPVFDTFLRILNEAYAADPQAIHALVCNRVPCNIKLGDHPTIQIMTNPIAGDGYIVGLLGIVNGICEVLTGKRVAARFSENGKTLGFQEYVPSSQPAP